MLIPGASADTRMLRLGRPGGLPKDPWLAALPINPFGQSESNIRGRPMVMARLCSVETAQVRGAQCAAQTEQRNRQSEVG